MRPPTLDQVERARAALRKASAREPDPTLVAAFAHLENLAAHLQAGRPAESFKNLGQAAAMIDSVCAHFHDHIRQPERSPHAREDLGEAVLILEALTSCPVRLLALNREQAEALAAVTDAALRRSPDRPPRLDQLHRALREGIGHLTAEALGEAATAALAFPSSPARLWGASGTPQPAPLPPAPPALGGFEMY